MQPYEELTDEELAELKKLQNEEELLKEYK